MSENIWKHRQYTRYFASYFLGNVGDWFDFFALQLIFAHQFNVSADQLVYMFAAYLVPMIALASFAGSVADKFDKKWLLFVTDLIAGFLTLAIIFAPTMYMALLVIAVRSAVISFNAAAQKVTSRLLLPEDMQLQATSYEQVAFQLCRIVGPMLGAVVVAISSPQACLAINAGSFFVSSIILLTLQSIKGEVPHEGEGGDAPKQSNFKMTLRFIRQNRLLRYFIPILFLGSMMIMMVELQMVILLRDIIPKRMDLLGYVIGVSAFGSVVSAFWLQKKSNIQQFGWYMVLCFLLVGVAYSFMGVYQVQWSIVLFFIAAFLSGFGLGIVFVLQPYSIKKEAPANKIGRISGVLSVVFGISYAVGVGFGGSLIQWVGAREAFIAIGVICFIIGLVTFCLKGKMVA